MNTSDNLPAALAGERRTFETDVGTISYYFDKGDGAGGVPLVLVHSINAAASAYEVKPVYDRYRGRRPVAAIDLPGYGFSTRAAIRYTPGVMTDAIHAWIEQIAADTGADQVDAMACSVACQYLARAAQQRPGRYRSIALVSPAGVDTRASARPHGDATRGKRWLYGAITASNALSRGLFSALSSRASIRYFLEKTFGGKDVDPGLIDYAYRSAHQPGARHAPWSFLSGYLFSADAAGLYRGLSQPVWLAYGKRSDFSDAAARDIVEAHTQSRVTSFDAGALPYFQQPDAFFDAYDRFIAALGAPA
ncbi:alpha/beta hydrolase fold protein [Salinisphaera sp. T5B8]|uniref:alpha/beta fold hydrolase n=1 Tax=Salinisphaera sp. T5B8 TaxID=1304154 RepID=UPI00334217F1